MTDRVLVLTDEAAAAVGVQPTSLTSWARRRGVRPVRHERRGRRTLAVWDLDALFEATKRRPTYDAATPMGSHVCSSSRPVPE